MSPTWHGGPPPEPRRRGPGGWLRSGIKALLFALLVAVGGLVLLAARLAERGFAGGARPLTPGLISAICRGAVAIVGLRVSVEGPRLDGHGALVANHVSWLDILVLYSLGPVFFVAKDSVATWPAIGAMASAAGTLFIRRDPRDSARQRDLILERVHAGHRLLFFPEGTSTDGLQVVAFKPTLFAAFFHDTSPDRISIQPVSVIYTAPNGEDPRFYGWWGDMGFGPHFLDVLSVPRQGRVRVVFHPPLRVADFADRKALARAAEAAVRAPFESV